MITRHCLAKLLQRPHCGRVRGYVAVQDLSRPNFHDHEHVKHSKSRGHRNQKITGNDRSRVIMNECLPMLRGCSLALPIRFWGPICPHRPRRNIDPELQ